MRAAHLMVLIIIAVALLACQSRKDGAIEGSVVPTGVSASVTIMSNGKDAITVPVNGQDGSFSVAVVEGTYIITITTPGANFPVRLEGIVVRSGETTKLQPITVTPAVSKATLSGKVFPSQPGCEVKLMYEGKERASVQTDKEGRYEFKDLPAGTYEVMATSAGYAEDRAAVAVTESRKTDHTPVLLLISQIDGVDWESRKIRVMGIGLPPGDAQNSTIRKAMAERAAIADAQRKLLRTIEQIRIDKNRDIKTAMGDQRFAGRIQGFIKGYAVVNTRELGGKVEVVLELPLSGPSGLTRHIVE